MIEVDVWVIVLNDGRKRPCSARRNYSSLTFEGNKAVQTHFILQAVQGSKVLLYFSRLFLGAGVRLQKHWRNCNLDIPVFFNWADGFYKNSRSQVLAQTEKKLQSWHGGSPSDLLSGAKAKRIQGELDSQKFQKFYL